MASPKRSSEQQLRQTTTPFHLKLFYRLSSFHHPADFPMPTPTNPSPPLPQHLQIYTWPTCSLLELSQLLTTALPNLMPSPSIGTRLSFRLVFPDTRPPPRDGRMREDDGLKGRWTFKEMGSVVVVAAIDAGNDNTNNNENVDDDEVIMADGEAGDETGVKQNGNGSGSGSTTAGPKFRNTEEAERTLADMRFVIGDYIDCAVFPPQADGSIAPAGPRWSSATTGGAGGGFRSGPPPPSPRDNGYGRSRGGGYGLGRGDGYGTGSRNAELGGGRLPPGEWRRGERLPESGYRTGYSGGRGRRGGY